MALTDPRLSVGLIADLHHVDPIALQVAFASAAGRIMLVTDNLSTFGMPPGRYELGGAPVAPADLVVLDPDELRVRATWIGGRRAG